MLRLLGLAQQALLLGAALHAVATHAVVFRGVNLGSWLVTEPWMVSTLYASTNAPDEWTLCNTLGKKQCLSVLQNHWATFITRDDMVQIKNAGLRFVVKHGVRIPIGYWAVDLLDYEPYVAGSYPYLIQAVQWAQQLGLSVFIDLHGVPGSQNGWALSGIVGHNEFLANTTNTDRTLNVLRNLTAEFSQSIYGGAVTNIEIVNEPTIDYASLRSFYTPASNVVGAGNSSGINITISDGFYNPHSWQNFDPWNPQANQTAPHITLDTHQFWAFPPLDKLDKTGVLNSICTFAKNQLRVDPSEGTPPTLVGEWSLSTGVTSKSSVDAAQDRAKRTWFRQLFEAQNAAFTPTKPGDASIGWYFWSWKTDYDVDAWSYRKGIALGYIPSNISDPSTYAYPIGSDGCIDQTFQWNAPMLSTATPTFGIAAGATGSVAQKGAGNSRAALPFSGEHGLWSWAAIGAASFLGMML
ncbi:glycoside hydrolase family 5 protein [Dissoconium aciculare CBS 342.82]|uniref:glucan 1,3-beta-glucosidase n=1 Tax=Dissoconium aciculare CBS 342.82 TaxID=1314786 RepID=A0A6J3LQH3_9PEZI|nr:glycoside hydrolase family 5 protein [Dissoconium aciculare CBS 342.82]KAF1818090.1 glycoside hydrolase family 5 protein [Dissoconium aciculare CBS 342.82]